MASEDKQLNLTQKEEKILEFWERNKIFEKSLLKNKGKKTFIFYEGPPTANGRPHIGHAEARVFKDLIPRYKTMRGFFVPRKGGWDTHGLPVEIEVEKELGFKTKHDIETYGLGRFNKKAKESVWKYKNEWEKFTKRLGFWIDLEHPYITYEVTYMETLWWIMKEIGKKKLLYQDFKVVPWCPRCETGLSSHEVGQGYKKVKENSIYARLKLKNRKNEYLLIWTTTPWTLPANVAVAINPQIDYTKYKINKEYLWSATTPPYGKDEKAAVLEKVSGKSLLGLEYEPLFEVPPEYSSGGKLPYKTVAADFVSTEEGTGMVHVAPAFGDDDMNVVKKTFGTNYPILHTVTQSGKMKKGIIGEGKFVKDADKLIIENLKNRGLLQQIELYEHDYPFCWRCGTPLLYFAKTSWWIRMSALKNKLKANNDKINWVPEYLKHGRFGEFLEEIRDWAFSRERYWGTPLPVWECGKCKTQEIMGSREELSKRAGKTKNTYFIMRHGEALSNLKNKVSYAPDGKYRETLKGLVQDEKAAQKLKKEKIDLIFSSDVLRTKQTAEVAAKVLGIKKIFIDKRLREINTGIFEGQSPQEYYAYFSSTLEKFTKNPPQGENLTELRRRVTEFLEETEKKYSGKNILIVSHEYPLWLLFASARGLSNEETVAIRERKKGEDFIGFAEVLRLDYKKLPRDENKEVNLHRPYVDRFILPCLKCGGVMKRVPEVVDVWFDSGSMPFAQNHYPFDKKIFFPADYITEAVDQTRGWFYTLLAVSTLLGRSAPYKNVISLGHVLDKNGQKMSKSKGNVVDPEEMIKKYGADTLRWYFYTINAPGEPKNFDEKDLLVRLRGFLMTVWNSFLLLDAYVNKVKSPLAVRGQRARQKSKVKSENILDQWVLIKLDELVKEVTEKLDKYDVVSAARLIEGFVINDFSQWYLRRSRRRFQHPRSEKELDEVAETSLYVLLTVCKLSAPFIPFLSEIIYQELRKKTQLKELSVHLTSWPKVTKGLDKKDRELLNNMVLVREIVGSALKERAQVGIKVRQPLSKLQITNYQLQKTPEFLELIKEEVNVKNIAFGKELKLDIVITPELKEEGLAREFIRNVQEMRRDLGLKPQQIIICQITGSEAAEKVISRWREMIKKDTNTRELKIGGKKTFAIERELDFDGQELWVGISRK